jgi:hypothetical protein
MDCFTTRISTLFLLLHHMTQCRFYSGWFRSNLGSAQVRFGLLSLLRTPWQSQKKLPTFNEGAKLHNYHSQRRHLHELECRPLRIERIHVYTTHIHTLLAPVVPFRVASSLFSWCGSCLASPFFALFYSDSVPLYFLSQLANNEARQRVCW